MGEKKRIALALLLAAMVTLAGCSSTGRQENTAETSGEAAQTEETKEEEEPVVGQSQPLEEAAQLPAIPEELEEVNRLHEAVVAGIYNRSWDDPMQIDPESFPTYYQYLIARVPELEEQSGKYTDEQLNQILVPQGSLESVVTSHFELPVERIRESSCYRPEQQAYELGGIGGGASVQIVSADQQDGQLVMEYRMFSARNLPMSHGTVTADVDGDSWIYRSVTNEQELSFRLEEPNAMGQTIQDGAFLMFSESSLDEIAQFYQETLSELGIEGEETKPQGEDSWGFEGSGSEGGKVTIEVIPEAQGRYQISYTVEE